MRCCSSPRYCKKDDSFAGARSGTTVLRQAVWEGREEDDFEPGDLLDRDKRRFDGRNPRWEGDDMKAFIS